MNSKDKFSLITIVKGREEHLHNQLIGVRRSSYIPDEIIIVAIDDTPVLEKFGDLPIRLIHLKSSDKNLPVAKARNAGALAARYEHLIFLDVDCIPSGNFFTSLFDQGKKHRTLIMGNPRYLTLKISNNTNEKELHRLSIAHPHRPKINKLEHSPDWMLFWSLCFYIPTNLFLEIGGFDESYTGYGAEDTDLSLKLNQTGKYDFLLSEAVVYHQQHPVYSPPVHQLDSIVTNAEVFYKKWNRWVMENWLSDFKNYNLIEWEEDSDRIKSKSMVSNHLLQKCFKPDAPFM